MKNETASRERVAFLLPITLHSHVVVISCCIIKVKKNAIAAQLDQIIRTRQSGPGPGLILYIQCDGLIIELGARCVHL